VQLQRIAEVKSQLDKLGEEVAFDVNRIERTAKRAA